MKGNPTKTEEILKHISSPEELASMDLMPILTEMEIVIQEGAQEYGRCNISTAESRRYEDACTIVSIIQKVFDTDPQELFALLNEAVII